MSLATPSGFPSDGLSTLSEEELMLEVAAGRHDALTILFDRYQQLVFSIAFRILRDPGEAEEVVQTVFFDIFRAAASFDSSKGIFKVWLLQYAYHRALHRKRHLVANHFYSWEGLETAIEIGSSRALSGEWPEIVRLTEQMLAKLKAHQRAVVQMTYFEGLTAEEIAGRLGRSVHAVRHDLHRSLATLGKALKNGS